MPIFGVYKHINIMGRILKDIEWVRVKPELLGIILIKNTKYWVFDGDYILDDGKTFKFCSGDQGAVRPKEMKIKMSLREVYFARLDDLIRNEFTEKRKDLVQYIFDRYNSDHVARNA